jgi:hypothetical protein
MFNSDRKKTLKDAKARLEEAGSILPPRAKAFRRAQADVLQDINQALGTTFPDSAHAESLAAQAEELIRLSPKLNSLCLGAAALEQQVDDLRQDATEQAAPDLAALITGRCTAWLAELKDLGVKVSSDRDLNTLMRGGQDPTARIAVLVRQHRSAMEKLVEASALIVRFGKGAKTGVLDSAAANLRDRLFGEGPSPQTIEALELQLDPLRREAAAPPPPPPEPPDGLRHLRSLIPAAHQWVQALQTDGAPLRTLREDIQLLENRPELWESSAVEDLRGRARRMVESLQLAAAAERDEGVRLLSEWAGYYTAACEPHEGLDAKLASLCSLPVQDPSQFEEWRQGYDDAKTFFQGLAKAKLPRLESYCTAQVQKLQTRVDALLTERLTGETMAGVEEAGRRIQQLNRVQGRDQILDALRKTSSLEELLARLTQQMDTDLATYNSDRARLLDRRTELADAIRIAKLEIPIADFAEPANASLDTCRHYLRTVSDELDRLSTLVLETCAAAQAEHAKFCASAVKALRAVNLLAIEEPVTPATGADPRARAADCARLAEARLALWQALELAAEKQTGMLDGYREKLSGVESAADDNQERARDLLELANMDFYRDLDPLEKTKALAGLASQCNNFLMEVDRPRREALALRGQLLKRWSDFLYQDGLRDYFPRYFQRVMALISGVPEPTLDWAAAKAQWTEADRILRHLRTQARRAAAAELAAACIVLNERSHSAPPDSRDEIHRVLLEVKACGDAFPPLETRHAALELAERR